LAIEDEGFENPSSERARFESTRRRKGNEEKVHSESARRKECKEKK